MSHDLEVMYKKNIKFWNRKNLMKIIYGNSLMAPLTINGGEDGGL